MKTKMISFFLLAFFFWLLSWYLGVKYLEGWSQRGTFGDMFGAVNALFSGLAFAGIIIALILQKEELALQRQELKETREELKGQREQMELQNQFFKKQVFENTFFQLLKLHNDIISSYKILKKANPVIEISGRACFKEFYDTFRRDYSLETKNFNKHDLSFIDFVYAKFYEQHRSDLPHCFRSLYSIISFVQGADISNKEFYTDLVRAQLSTHEQLILFYHCLSRYGKDKFRPLVVEFQLLKEMPENLLKESVHEQYYPQEAYGK